MMSSKTNIAITLLLTLCVAAIIGEFIIHRHSYFALEATPLFFALMGFASLCIIVGGGALLRKLVTRPSDYYEEGGDDDA